MRLAVIPLLLLSSFLTGCVTEEIHPTTVRSELVALNIPLAYTVEQKGYNSGYAGVIGTGEFNETITFTVGSEKVTSGTSDNMKLLTITDIKNDLWQYADEMNASGDVKDWGCYEYERWGVKRVKACFLRKQLVSYDLYAQKGSHQHETLSWKIRTE